MFTQKEVLRDGVAMTFNQTWELDLPKSGHLMGLVLYLRSTAVSNAFLTAVKWRLIDYISKIEVIGDGSEIIKSFDGRQALASAFYDDFRHPPSMWRTYATTPQRQFIPINFGRHFMDEIYGLDLSKYNQVTLKITNDATSTQFATSVQASVVALWMRENPNGFFGHFREEEWKTWLPVADAWEYNELPIALSIRRILLRHRNATDAADAKNNSSFHRGMDDIEFSYRSGQTRVYRGSLELLGHISVMEMPCLAEIGVKVDRTQGYGFETDVGYVTQAVMAGAADSDGQTANLANARMDVQESAQESGYRPANGNLQGVVRGHGYGHCVPLFYARKDDLDDLLIPNDVKQVDVNIHGQSGSTFSGDTAAESAIVLSRLVR
ncbi:hypothetical protein LCGC14_0778950 [marine sediment metagenome]|uniref:Uncharacterized protein n=1 Tax=marine sediment metagenome TaxID=412755 RepID=A0A0F9SFY2_9ZZZZ